MAKRITPREASDRTVVELRKMLGKLNKEARARIRELEKGGYGDTVAAQKLINPVRGMKKHDLISAVSDVSLFLSQRRSQVDLVRKDEKKMLKTLHKHGFDMVDSSNLRQFGNFMDTVRERHGKLRVDSETAAKIYDYIEEKGIDFEEFSEAFGKYLSTEKGMLDLEKALSDVYIRDGRTAAAKLRNAMKGFGWI